MLHPVRAPLRGCAARRAPQSHGEPRHHSRPLPRHCSASEGVSTSSWSACVQQVSALGFAADEADLIVRKAHGHGAQGYWRGSKKNEEPDEGALAARLDYLRSVCSSEAGLRDTLRLFPEALGLDVSLMSVNVALLGRSYGIKEGPALDGVLSRKPSVLGNTLDCSGDCAGECNRCWARF